MWALQETFYYLATSLFFPNEVQICRHSIISNGIMTPDPRRFGPSTECLQRLGPPLLIHIWCGEAIGAAALSARFMLPETSRYS